MRKSIIVILLISLILTWCWQQTNHNIGNATLKNRNIRDISDVWNNNIQSAWNLNSKNSNFNNHNTNKSSEILQNKENKLTLMNEEEKINRTKDQNEIKKQNFKEKWKNINSNSNINNENYLDNIDKKISNIDINNNKEIQNILNILAQQSNKTIISETELEYINKEYEKLRTTIIQKTIKKIQDSKLDSNTKEKLIKEILYKEEKKLSIEEILVINKKLWDNISNRNTDDNNYIKIWKISQWVWYDNKKNR